MKILQHSLLLKIIIAIALGSVLGRYLPEAVSRIFITFNGVFGNFLGFAIPLIIVGLIIPAIGHIGKNAGKLLLITTGIAYGSTVLSGLASYGVSISVFPKLLQFSQLNNLQEQTQQLIPYFEIGMPPLFDVMSALIVSFLIGISISSNHFPHLEGVFDEFQKIIMRLINSVIIPLLPLFIFGIFLDMTYSRKVFLVLDTFIKIIGVIFILHLLLLLLQYCIAGAISGRNPLSMMKTMFPAYLTALGTQSSVATIPVTLKQAIANKVDPKIAGFTIPLCATIHLAGSTLKIVCCAIALMLIQGSAIDSLQIIGFIFMLGIAMVAAPGVPGGAIMAALGVLQSVLGFDSEQQSLMIALYIAMDSFGTACNVMGDGAIAVIVDRIAKLQK